MILGGSVSLIPREPYLSLFNSDPKWVSKETFSLLSFFSTPGLLPPQGGGWGLGGWGVGHDTVRGHTDGHGTPNHHHYHQQKVTLLELVFHLALPNLKS